MRIVPTIALAALALTGAAQADAQAIGSRGSRLDPTAGCPVVSDMLWVADTGAIPPRSWQIGAVRDQCGGRFTSELRKRVWQHPIAQTLYGRMLSGSERVAEFNTAADTARALYVLAWMAPLSYRDLLLAYVRTEPVSEEGEYGYMPFATALDGMARYAAAEPSVRTRLLSLLHDGESPWVRQRALHTLMRVNDAWARTALEQVPKRDLTQQDRALLRHLAADGPCEAGTFWQECYGVDGQQRAHRCQAPPPEREWCAF